jgi:hypothetical protein
MKYLFLLLISIISIPRAALAEIKECKWHLESLTDSIDSPVFRESFYQSHVKASNGQEILVELGALKKTEKIESLSRNLEEVDFDFSKLSTKNQETLWSEVIYPRLKLQEQMFLDASKQGDEVAKLALRLPHGKRDDLLEAAILMKNVDIKKSRRDIADELALLFKDCLK